MYGGSRKRRYIGTPRSTGASQTSLSAIESGLLRREARSENRSAVEREGADAPVDLPLARSRLHERPVASLQHGETLLLLEDVAHGVLDRRDLDQADLDDLGAAQHRRERVLADEDRLFGPRYRRVVGQASCTRGSILVERAGEAEGVDLVVLRRGPERTVSSRADVKLERWKRSARGSTRGRMQVRQGLQRRATPGRLRP